MRIAHVAIIPSGSENRNHSANSSGISARHPQHSRASRVSLPNGRVKRLSMTINLFTYWVMRERSALRLVMQQDSESFGKVVVKVVGWP
jgi:hypothetical protein